MQVSAVPSFDAPLIRQLTPMPALISALRATFAAKLRAPLRQTYEISAAAKLLLMPAWRGESAGGVKVVTVRSDVSPAVRATYLLLDGHNGSLRAIMDGAVLTKRRTAAASALASTFLSRPDAECLLMVGTGELAPNLIEAHCSVRPIRRVLVWGRNPDKARATVLLATGNENGPRIEAQAVTDLRSAMAQADIISCATLATEPLIMGAAVKAGTHIDLVGAFRPNMCEADPTCFARGRIFVDIRDGALEEAGDLIQAMAARAMTAEDIEAELEELCCDEHPGRGAHPDDITVFKSVGSAIEDLAAAELVFDTWKTYDA